MNFFSAAKVKTYSEGKIVCDTQKGEKVIACDSVILAAGYDSSKFLYNKIRFDVPAVHLLGDARRMANIMHALWNAFEVANGI